MEKTFKSLMDAGHIAVADVAADMITITKKVYDPDTGEATETKQAFSRMGCMQQLAAYEEAVNTNKALIALMDKAKPAAKTDKK